MNLCYIIIDVNVWFVIVWEIDRLDWWIDDGLWNLGFIKYVFVDLRVCVLSGDLVGCVLNGWFFWICENCFWNGGISELFGKGFLGVGVWRNIEFMLWCGWWFFFGVRFGIVVGIWSD